MDIKSLNEFMFPFFSACLLEQRSPNTRVAFARLQSRGWRAALCAPREVNLSSIRDGRSTSSFCTRAPPLLGCSPAVACCAVRAPRGGRWELPAMYADVTSVTLLQQQEGPYLCVLAHIVRLCGTKELHTLTSSMMVPACIAGGDRAALAAGRRWNVHRPRAQRAAPSRAGGRPPLVVLVPPCTGAGEQISIVGWRAFHAVAAETRGGAALPHCCTGAMCSAIAGMLLGCMACGQLSADLRIMWSRRSQRAGTQSRRCSRASTAGRPSAWSPWC